MSAKQASPAAPKCPRGFTLVELLVVVGIIALLISMLLPTFGRAKLIAQNARARAWLAELGNGCIAYQRETGFYPGQQDQGFLVGSHPTTGTCSYCGLSGTDTSRHSAGSQYLSMIFFGQGRWDTGASQVKFDYPSAAMGGKWAAFNQNDILIDAKYKSPSARLTVSVAGQPSATLTPNPGYISDRMNAPLPVLYFVSRPGMTGMNQYKYNDNTTASYDPYKEGRTSLPAAEQYMFGTDPTNNLTNPGFIGDPRATGATLMPRNPNGFILIGAGMDRTFFTGDDLIFPAW